jgi:hypothetical protein
MAEFLAALGELLKALGTVAAVIVAVIVYRGQKRLTRELAERSGQLTRELAERGEQLAQRQLILPLWGYLSSIPEIGPGKDGKYIEPDIIKAVNTLELVALCCEGNMVDESIIFRTFSEVYIKAYDAIKRVPTIASRRGITGDDLLRENRAAMAFYDRLAARLKNADRIPTLGKTDHG